MAQFNFNGNTVEISELENRQIIWRNFEGVAKEKNNAGNRNFGITFDDPQIADKLAELGVKVAIREHEDGSVDFAFGVKVGFTLRDGSRNPRAPELYKIDSTGIKKMREEDVKMFDQAVFTKVDLSFNLGKPYVSTKDGNEYRSAYLKEMYGTIQESNLRRKYNSMFNEDSSEDVDGDAPFDI